MSNQIRWQHYKLWCEVLGIPQGDSKSLSKYVKGHPEGSK
jgi:hypothetical protein